MRPIILIVLCHAACADPVEDLGPAELVLGSGPEVFVPVTDGDSVAIMDGLQGGTVMWGAVQARNVEVRDVELLFTVTPPSGPPSARRFVVDLDDAGTVSGLAVFLLDQRSFAGQPCVWRVELHDRTGRMAADEKTVIPTPAE
jgi:hypothetical protein